MTRRLDLEGPAALLARSGLKRLLAALDGDGEETRIVGGAVRNALLGRAVTEVDLASTALPHETVRRASGAGLKTVPTGLEHGTVTVLVGGTPYEVTTLREDVETDGRHAVVRFGRDFSLDAQRRDFTVNALSVDREGQVHDYTGGLEDLAAGRLRFIGDAGARIREDYLRILRFFRFSAEYADGPFDASGIDAATRGRDGLAHLSRERVRAEFLKLLAAPRALDAVEVLSDTGLLLRLLGSVGDRGRLGRASRADTGPVWRLAALAVLTTEDADRLRDRLRLSNAEHEALALYGQISEKLHALEFLDRAEARRLAAGFDTEPLLQALAVLAGEPRPIPTLDGAAQIERFASGAEARPVFGRTGRDLMREGVRPGPELGRRLAAERCAWMAAGCPA